MASAASPTKRSSKLVGKRSVTGGIKLAPEACQSVLTGKWSFHHCRQRSRVRKGIASAADSLAAPGFCPACRAEPSTTTSAR